MVISDENTSVRNRNLSGVVGFRSMSKYPYGRDVASANASRKDFILSGNICRP